MDQGSSNHPQEVVTAEYDRKKAERLERLREARRSKKPAAEIRADKMARLAKAREVLNEKKKFKALVMEKVEKGMPITDTEREILEWSPGKAPAPTRQQQEALTIAKAAKLLIQPKHVTELRVLVERTADKFSYNPIEKLIMEAESTDDEELRVSIHKALLPFLVPVLQVPRQKAEEPGGGGVKVTITQFQFADEKKGPLHQQAPAMVTIEANAEGSHG